MVIGDHFLSSPRRVQIILNLPQQFDSCVAFDYCLCHLCQDGIPLYLLVQSEQLQWDAFTKCQLLDHEQRGVATNNQTVGCGAIVPGIALKKNSWRRTSSPPMVHCVRFNFTNSNNPSSEANNSFILIPHPILPHWLHYANTILVWATEIELK